MPKVKIGDILFDKDSGLLSVVWAIIKGTVKTRTAHGEDVDYSEEYAQKLKDEGEEEDMEEE